MQNIVRHIEDEEEEMLTAGEVLEILAIGISRKYNKSTSHHTNASPYFIHPRKDMGAHSTSDWAEGDG